MVKQTTYNCQFQIIGSTPGASTNSNRVWIVIRARQLVRIQYRPPKIIMGQKLNGHCMLEVLSYIMVL